MGQGRRAQAEEHGQLAAARPRAGAGGDRPTSNQAQQLQQQALTSSPGNDSTFSGGTLGTLSEDPVTQAQAAADSEQQSKLLTAGEHDRQEGERLVEALDGHLRQDRRAARVRQERPRGDDLAQLRLGGAERERHEDRDQGLRGVPQARARRRQRAAGQDDPEAAQGGQDVGLDDDDAVIDIETTPDGATLVSVSEPLDYGVVADLAEVLTSDTVRESHHIVIELSAPGSMDESAVGVLVRSARDTRLRGGRLTLCGADDRVRDALERIGVARLVQLADDADSALDSGRAA